jgi:hypothetical protein
MNIMREESMLTKTPLPEARAEDIFPPISESRIFTYFDHIQDHPFNSAATTFSLVNAWRLADAALLAYSGPGEAVRIFQRAGLTVANDRPFVHEHGQCYLASNDRMVIAAFRGTEVLRPDRWESLHEAWRNFVEASADAATDAKFALTECPPASGRYVHRGFLIALDGMWAAIAAQLHRLQEENPARTFWFTGHSLGGALATLAAARFDNAQGLYTYGCPYVGDAAFAAGFRVPAYRFVNNTDIVPRVPPRGPYCPPKIDIGTYEHVGELRYLTEEGRLEVNPSNWRRWESRIGGELRHVGEALRGIFHRHPLALAPKDLNDHAPLYYALRLRNLYVDTL